MHDQTNNIIRAHKNYNGTKLDENNNIATICSHNVCIFSNYSLKDFKIVNLISISIIMGERRYKTFVKAISKTIRNK